MFSQNGEVQMQLRPKFLYLKFSLLSVHSESTWMERFPALIKTIFCFHHRSLGGIDCVWRTTTPLRWDWKEDGPLEVLTVRVGFAWLADSGCCMAMAWQDFVLWFILWVAGCRSSRLRLLWTEFVLSFFFFSVQVWSLLCFVTLADTHAIFVTF